MILAPVICDAIRDQFDYLTLSLKTWIPPCPCPCHEVNPFLLDFQPVCKSNTAMAVCQKV